MNRQHNAFSRRAALKGAAGWAAGLGVSSLTRATALAQRASGAAPKNSQALVAITLDLEMMRHYPEWEDMHWDYEKGNLDIPTKNYAVEAARRVKAKGGVIHFFCVARVLEQEDVSWLRLLHETGHPIGNHTYDHVYLLATRPEQIQFRFARAPWLMGGKEPTVVIRDNIRLATEAMKQRLGIDPVGFRTPGGFNNGLRDRPDIQQMLLDLGFKWVSSLYPLFKMGEVGGHPTPKILDDIRRAQALAQPFVYPSGLIEVPMNPVSDVNTMRALRWNLDDFLEAIRVGVEWAIETGGTYDFLCHPSCMNVMDPNFRALDLIFDLVQKAGDRATIADLTKFTARAKPEGNR
jgi:peptidoglycan/xylan/chitin deacetylase (PgdA/CDA1 family)